MYCLQNKMSLFKCLKINVCSNIIVEYLGSQNLRQAILLKCIGIIQRREITTYNKPPLLEYINLKICLFGKIKKNSKQQLLIPGYALETNGKPLRTYWCSLG